MGYGYGECIFILDVKSQICQETLETSLEPMGFLKEMYMIEIPWVPRMHKKRNLNIIIMCENL